MILPTFYGLPFNNDKAWESLRLSQLSIDTIKFTNATTKIINITQINTDVFKYTYPNHKIKITTMNTDLLKFKTPEYTIECSSLSVDLLKNAIPQRSVEVSSVSIDLLRY